MPIPQYTDFKFSLLEKNFIFERQEIGGVPYYKLQSLGMMSVSRLVEEGGDYVEKPRKLGEVLARAESWGANVVALKTKTYVKGGVYLFLKLDKETMIHFRGKTVGDLKDFLKGREGKVKKDRVI